MNRWFRFYDDTINDPKTLKLSDKTYRIWVGILCATSKNDGVIPPFDDLLILLRVKANILQQEIEKLIAAELIDHDDNGMRPHNWDKRQYKSDVSTDRVKRFRNGERNVSETPPETEADTENRTEKKDSRSVAKATRPTDEHFENFKKAYPKRKGPNPWPPARKLFDAAVKSGTDPFAIVAAVRAGVGFDREKIGTEFIQHARKWLHDRCWEDHAPPSTAGPLQAPSGAPSDEELRKKYGQQHHAVPPETKAAGGNGERADHGIELRSAGAEVRPILRSF